MKVLKQNKKIGEIELYIESLDDLWHLKNLLIPGDLVWASTHRRKEEKGDKLRTERTEKKRMRLAIRVEKIEFQMFQDKIRILGTIEEGPQDLGQHHTLLLGQGDKLTVIKVEWKKHELDRIMSAVQDAKRPSIYFVSMDDTEAAVLEMGQFSMRELGNLSRTGTGKMYDSKDSQNEFFEEITGILKSSVKNEPIVVIGPGFAKERFLSYMREKNPELSEITSTAATGQTGKAGVYEAIKKGLGGKILEESRIVVETTIMEDIFKRISTDEPVAYGPEQVREAVNAGAVEMLVLTDKEVRTELGEELMKDTEKLKGRIEIISTTHNSGEQLKSLGGYAAILRYKISY